MRNTAIMTILIAAIGGCGGNSDAASGESSTAASDAAAALVLPSAAPARTAALIRPDLARCEHYTIEEGEQERQRTKPLVFPAALKDVVATDADHVAVSTLGGGTQCIDARWQDSIHDARVTASGRLFGYAWDGYEAYGYQLIDRQGKGQVIETGARPVPSPSARRLAAVEWSESGFGGLNGVLVLQVQSDGIKQLAKIDDLPGELTDWKLSAWKGEDCFELSAVRFADMPDGGDATPATPRQRFTVRNQAGTWALASAAGGCPAG